MEFAELIATGIPALSDVLEEIYKDVMPAVKKGHDKIGNACHRKYAENYVNRHGLLNVWCVGMRKPIPLESVYVAVNILNLRDVNRYRSLEEIETIYRKGGKRRFQFPEKRWQGIIIAEKEQHLMVLGGPGVGKSTFLRKVGLEALKGKEGNFKHQCIPVFIELKDFTDEAVSIEEKITEEFAICDYPAPKEMTEAALRTGRLLVLLDGLDEVPSKNTDAVVRQIQNFVDKYSNNRFIASCRIAAYKGGFTRFTNMEIADFNDNQIKDFIEKWFQSQPDPRRLALDEKMKTVQRCWKALEADEATKELAQNPLLLTLLCMVYDTSQNFPKDRATLYREALYILLKEWAAEKRIQRDPIYKDLTLPLEEDMLSEI